MTVWIVQLYNSKTRYKEYIVCRTRRIAQREMRKWWEALMESPDLKPDLSRCGIRGNQHGGGAWIRGKLYGKAYYSYLHTFERSVVGEAGNG